MRLAHRLQKGEFTCTGYHCVAVSLKIFVYAFTRSVCGGQGSVSRSSLVDSSGWQESMDYTIQARRQVRDLTLLTS